MNNIDSDRGGIVGKINRNVALAGAALLLVAILGMVAVHRFVAAEGERDLQQWQVRLGIVAASRAQAVGEWQDRQFATLSGLADNLSLQLYLTELSLAGGQPAAVTDQSAQAEYLANLLILTAEQSGFSAPVQGANVQANVSRVGVAGLALVNKQGEILVTTPGTPTLDSRLHDFVRGTKQGGRGVLDIYTGASGQATMAFLQPIFAVQGENRPADQVGAVLGIRLVGDDLFQRLVQPGETLNSGQTYLVRKSGATVEYLSPLADGTPPLKRALALDTSRLAAAGLLERIGGFGIFANYQGVEVLATSRGIQGLPWALIRSVERSEALAASDRRQSILLIGLWLVIAVVTAIIIAVWRHGSSVRVAAAAAGLQQSNAQLQTVSDFLRIVTDSQPTAIAAVDGQGQIMFANSKASEEAGVVASELIGKTLPSAMGVDKAKHLQRANDQAVEKGQPLTEWRVENRAEGRRVVKSDHIPLRADGADISGVLMIQEDITDLVDERERRARILRELVQTCVAVVDRRDPFSAHHSERVAEVASAIAKAMHMDEAAVETCDIAGALMNLGKVTVPREVLIKTEKLTDAELNMVRESVLTSADLIDGVEFDGPVADTIRQIQERWDGTGQPANLAGEEILSTARIVAVANAFVGMVSARAYRPGMTFDEAAKALMSGTSTAFDSRPVSALLNYLDIEGGRQRWAHFGISPQNEQN
ncbi:MAG: PAS domain-containing protein [Rhodospirillaceae bacterium]|jgi:PAS domain S-box-containing protein|nr:PAS domain-containing protein [Rhodospirillaceae bacterium]MBT3494737.1 PAS domain-containing protein [Rhodospirillaceae bacterium]MBT3779092.1 PAS domain-containing protein [Rhodospirillaceae bacterium]MBT3976603.1 PAS domain-containing protein [Rhodospirillaceae bacterium]MBT4564646.1 PAS domain-containing protein [Rhodospirillaceae bacterium]